MRWSRKKLRKAFQEAFPPRVIANVQVVPGHSARL